MKNIRIIINFIIFFVLSVSGCNENIADKEKVPSKSKEVSSKINKKNSVGITVNKTNLLLNGKKVFVNGSNIAWDNFADDFADRPLNKSKFKQIIEETRLAGGNSLRIWIFTNCANAPKFDNNRLVRGLGKETINNIRLMLDMAVDNGVVMSLCLLSFDMMQSKQHNVKIKNNIKLLTTDEGAQSWIRNALMPLVKEIGLHSGLLCYEIFNEPEGMIGDQRFGGWAKESKNIKMRDIQKFINLSAGAIHRTVPGVLVSNGSWSMKASSPKCGFRNFYSNEELIAAGGDKQGTLDFYQIHWINLLWLYLITFIYLQQRFLTQNKVNMGQHLYF